MVWVLKAEEKGRRNGAPYRGKGIAEQDRDKSPKRSNKRGR